MAVPFSQLVASTYDAVIDERGKAANQFSENAVLRFLEKLGGVKRVTGGSTLDHTLDYRANPDAGFLAADTSTTSTTKTSVMTAAQYDWGEIVVPVNWTLGDEAKNSGDSQKIDLVSGLVDNAIETHDDVIEAALFGTTTNGFIGLQTLIAANGAGTIGSVNAGVETWWANHFATYDPDGSDLEAALTALFAECAKGSGSMLAPNLIVSGPDAHATYEGTLQTNQRYVNSDEASAGFTALKFKNADFIFSQHGDDSIYMFPTKAVKLHVIKGFFRKRREAIEHINAAMMNMKVVSVCQLSTSNRSRCGVLTATT